MRPPVTLRALLALCLLATLCLPATAQTIAGLTLGAAIPEGGPAPDDSQTQAPFTRTFWAVRDGMQVTAIADSNTGEVVFIELRPSGAPETGDAQVLDLAFGQTTRADLHARFGSEGIVFETVGRAGVFGQVAAYFTTYEIEGGDNVLSFVTIEALADASDSSGDASTLDSVVVAQGSYLNRIWGLNRGRLPGYEPIADPFGD